MYGLVAAAFTLVMVMVIGGFYSLNLGAHLGLVALIVLSSFAVGLIVRWRQMRRHKLAHVAEYESATGDDVPDLQKPPLWSGSDRSS
jgi:hypothetical protein